MLMVPEDGARPGTRVPRISAILRPAASCWAICCASITCTVPGIEAMLASLRLAEITVSPSDSGSPALADTGGAGCRVMLRSPLKRHSSPLPCNSRSSACSAL
ncbi:hypothetical protein D3C81_1550540 [compost metagenome]